MDMHDNEIDQLFRSKLEHLETEPSANLWQNIARRLDGPGAKRSLVPYLRIAASVIVVLTAGTWLLLKSGKTDEQNTTPVKVALKHQPQYTLPNPGSSHTDEQVQRGISAEINKVAATPSGHTFAKISHTKEKAVQQQVSLKKVNIKDEVVLPAGSELQLASVNVPNHEESNQAMVPDVVLTAQQLTKDDAAFKTTANLPATANLASATSTKTKSKRHGIHSLGDVVNLVVAKVDKRDDKLIEFSDTDDDEAVITGINLGLFRVKKDK